MKVIINGTLTEVGEVETKDAYSQQRGIIKVEGFNPNTGEPLTPQCFPFSVFNKKIKECNLASLVNRKVVFTGYLKSVTNEYEGRSFHNIMLNAQSVEEAV